MMNWTRPGAGVRLGNQSAAMCVCYSLRVLGIHTRSGRASDGPLGPERTRYARSGTLRIGYELQGTMHRRRSWLVLRLREIVVGRG
jgi:hypothetical protein